MPAARKSSELHDLHGTIPNGRAADLSQVPAGRPKFPRDLDASLKKIFKRLCSLLSERRTLTAGDAELLRLYCFQLDRHTRNVAALRAEGEVCTYTRLDSNGQPHAQVKANVRLKIVENSERAMAAILNQLGLTPTAKDRARPTRTSEQTVVPGSVADTMPHLVGLAPKPPAPIFVMTPDLEAALNEPISFDEEQPEEERIAE